jgi:hypothetical protein
VTTSSARLILRNDAAVLLGVYVEPYPSDYWLQPGERIRLVGTPGSGDVQVVRFEKGLTVWFGDDPDPEVHSLDGTRWECGHQRPE